MNSAEVLEMECFLHELFSKYFLKFEYCFDKIDHYLFVTLRTEYITFFDTCLAIRYNQLKCFLDKLLEGLSDQESYAIILHLTKTFGHERGTEFVILMKCCCTN